MQHSILDSLHEQTFAGMIAARVQSSPSLNVLTIEGGGQRPDDVRAYAELWETGLRVAQGLRELGLNAGDRFALIMANHVEFVEAMVAAGLAGAIFVPIDPRTRGEKLVHMLRHAGCRGAIVADYALAHLTAVRGDLPGLEWIVGLATNEAPEALQEAEGVHHWQEVAATDASGFEAAKVTPDSPMQILFTSGTTGDPKGIVMTHGRFCQNAMLGPLMFGYRPDDRPYSGLSLTHANAQLVTLGAALHGGMRCVLSRRFTKSRLWDITRQYGCTTFSLLGGMTAAVYAEPPRPDDADNPVRMVVSAGMPAAIWDDFRCRFDVEILEFYGAAEGGLTVNPAGVGPRGSIGKPVPILQHCIVDEHGQPVPRGEPGELWMRPADGSPATLEYYGAAEASARKVSDGWLRMGDVVVEDEEGWLFFQYRLGDGIRRNGEFINTAFVEKAIAESGEVEDVYVYGIPAASGAIGEKDIVAAVVPAKSQQLDPQQLFKLCREKLEPNFVPSYIQVLAEIPKTASEKPQNRYLIEAFNERPHEVHNEL